MGLSSRIKPISYLKAHAADIARTLDGNAGPLVITQSGEPKIVVQDVASYEATQETLALLKILALGRQEIEAGQTTASREVFRRLRARQRKP